MRDINLIPDKILYRKQRMLKRALQITLILIAAAALSALLLFRTYQRWELEDRLAKLSAGISASAIDELGRAESDLAARVKEKTDLAALYEKIPAEVVKPTELLRRITNLMPPAVTAAGIQYERETARLELLLTAKNRVDIVLFAKRLYNDPLTENINLSPVTGQEGAYSVTVSIKLKLQENDIKGGEAAE